MVEDLSHGLQSSINIQLAKNQRNRFDPKSVQYELERPDTAKEYEGVDRGFVERQRHRIHNRDRNREYAKTMEERKKYETARDNSDEARARQGQ